MGPETRRLTGPFITHGSRVTGETKAVITGPVPRTVLYCVHSPHSAVRHWLYGPGVRAARARDPCEPCPSVQTSQASDKAASPHPLCIRIGSRRSDHGLTSDRDDRIESVARCAVARATYTVLQLCASVRFESNPDRSCTSSTLLSLIHI